MLIAGLDPGRKHLGLCVFDTTREEILYWDVVQVDERSAASFVDTFNEIVDASHLTSCDTVYIERQPPKNSDMCKIQHYIELFLALRAPESEVVLVQASKRVKFLREDSSARGIHLAFDTYAQRKKSSVAYVDGVIDDGLRVSDSIRARYEASAKKDDWAEAFLLAHIHT